MELSKRQQDVLRALVERYIDSATPVASDALVRHDFPTVSSATIRNDLSALEEAGLIYQPHTSAGRIPSDRGYRFFVRYLLPDRGLSSGERRTILHQFSQVEDQIDEWLRLASAVLASATGGAAIVSAAAGAEPLLVRHFDLIGLDSRHVLLVAITSDADVRQQLLEVGAPLAPEALRREAQRLSARWADWSAQSLRDAGEHPGATDLETLVRGALAILLERNDQRRWEVRHHDGLANVLSQPEFLRGTDESSRRQRLQALLALVEHGEVVRDVFPTVARQGSMHILIAEDQPEALREVALVLCPYGDVHGNVGVLGVVGPTRLDYCRAITGTRYVAGILSGLMQEWRGTATE